MAEQHVQETASRIAAYAAGGGPCSCGQDRGHTGWLVCVLDPTPVVATAPVTTKRVAGLDCACEGREQEYRGRDGWWHCSDCDGRTDKLPEQCPKCSGYVKDAKDGPYRACVACGHVTDSDPGFS